MQVEIWKPIVGYDGLYEVSNLGRVKSLARFTNGKHRRPLQETIKKGFIDKTRVRISMVLSDDSGVKSLHIVSRLVAVHFVLNPFNKPDVCHKNRNWQDNNSENLFWTKEGETIKTKTKIQINDVLYESIKDASRKSGIHFNTIKKYLKSGLKNKFGKFSYYEMDKQIR